MNERITVNGETVDDDLVAHERAVLVQRHEANGERGVDPERMTGDAVENAIERVLLLQEARKSHSQLAEAEVRSRWDEVCRQLGGPVELRRRFEEHPDAEQQLRKDMEDGLRLEHLFEDLCREVAAPDEDELRAYYESHNDEFTIPERIRASHILQQPQPGRDAGAIYQDLLNARTEIRQGASFAEVARRYSHCRDDGGDLGWFERGAMVPAFEAVAFSLPVGQVSDVVQTEFGYHLILVMGHKPAVLQPLESVREKIIESLWNERKNAAIGVYVDRLRETAKILRETPVEEASPAPAGA